LGSIPGPPHGGRQDADPGDDGLPSEGLDPAVEAVPMLISIGHVGLR
jgi:hypothetical protein